ncbi:MAG TPA: hypothetical protein VK838_04300 [Candidatus Limnocylindrales bacterium]|nr:hypothetical protein [Candidatus Limnocylindrales bacterium]
MTGWLRRGAAAASLAGNRGDLWPPGTLAWLVYLGWLPILLVVAPPSGDDLEYIGVSLITSGSYPANVIALSVAAVAGFLLLCLLAAVGETALFAALRRAPGLATSQTGLSALAVVLLATVPVLIALAALVSGIIAAAPAAFTSPDVDTPVLLRLATALTPYLVGLLIALLVGQLFGGLALRVAIREAGRGTADAIRQALRRIVRDPWGPLGVTVVALVKDLLLFAASYGLLRVLWTPIQAGLGAGPLASPTTLLLLVGLVVTWLALLLIGGALHVAISAWWLAELSPVELQELHRAHGDEQPGPLGGHGT